MSHITLHRKRLTGRINRLIGQLEGLRRMVDEAAEGDDVVCYKVMQQLAAARGAMNGLMTHRTELHPVTNRWDRMTKRFRHIVNW